jgi:pimeloyl-ACP methyl ester carboxylesterase
MDPTTTFPLLDAAEEHFSVPGPQPGMSLFLRRLAATATADRRRAVLYVHGATFPSALSIAHRFDGRSWRDALCAAGFDVWGLDFYGFGHSDRYAEMNERADANPPLGSAHDAAAQIAVAARFILDREEQASFSLIAHSWGSMAASRFAGNHPSLVDRLVLFAPIARRDALAASPDVNGPAWREVSIADQWTRFVEDVPGNESPVLSRLHFDSWAERYLDSDPQSRSRDPATVRVPAGPFVDIQRAWQGELAYDPGRVRAPVAIIRGAWDRVVTDADARWLFDAFSHSTVKRDVKIGRATHLMHLETMRLALWRESTTFLLGDDVAAAPDH